MVARISFIAIALLLAPLASVRAGDVAPAGDASTSVDSTPAPSQIKTSYEFNADTSYVGDARTDFGSGVRGDVSEESTGGRLVIAPQINDGPIYRFGLAYQHYSFGFSKASPLPDILQSENVVVGMDFQIFNSWLVRVEADPGFYNDGRDTGFRDFNVPFTMGGSYIASEELQWIVGFEVDINRQIPIFPAVGAHWTINDSWTLDLVLPTPRLEYEWSKNLMLYLGGDVDDGTYRVDRGVAVALGDTKLSGAIVEYDEVRVGAGFSWRASKAVTLEIEGGYLPYREFDFHRANMQFSNDTGAPYGQVSLNAQF